MRRLLRDNGLSIAMFGLFIVFISAQSVMGLLDYNSTQEEHGQRPVSYVQYLGSGVFGEAVFENWESEFLQMGLYVLLTAHTLIDPRYLCPLCGAPGSPILPAWIVDVFVRNVATLPHDGHEFRTGMSVNSVLLQHFCLRRTSTMGATYRTALSRLQYIHARTLKLLTCSTNDNSCVAGVCTAL